MTAPLSLLGISCAYVGDILLQGHLYVTDNYLAFHSNVFGYVTKVSRVPRDRAFSWLKAAKLLSRSRHY